MKIYIGNLPYSTDDASLKELFGSFGTIVSATVISDRATGRSKGFGFVEFDSEEATSKAIEAMDNYEVDGRNIKVSKARPKD